MQAVWLSVRITLAAFVFLAARLCAADITPARELRFLHPARTVYSLALDKDGYLWAGTESELLRTDGHNFESILRGPGLLTGSTRVFRVAGAKDGSIWVGLGGSLMRVVDGQLVLDESPNNQGLYRWQRGAWEDHTGPEAVNRWIWSLLGDASGSMWVGDSRCLRQAQGPQVKSFCEAQGLQGAFVYTLATDEEGRLWGGTPFGAFYREGDRLESVPLQMPVVALALAGHGRMWAATPTGLTLFDRRGVVRRLTQADGLAANAVTALARSHDGSLWVGTSQGLSRVHGEDFAIEAVAPALRNTAILALQEDVEGALWIGTRTMGLARLSSRAVMNVSLAGAAAENHVRAVLQKKDGSTWATTSAGLARLDTSGEPRLGLVEPPPAAWGALALGSLAEAPDGTLLIATAGPFEPAPQTVAAGLLMYTQGQWRPLTKAQGLPSDDVSFILVDRAHELWIGFDHGGLARLSPNVLTAGAVAAGDLSLYAAADTCGAPIRAGIHDRQGGHWFAADGGGVVHIKHGHAPVCLGRQQGLKGLAATSVVQTKDNGVWVGVNQDGGIHLWNGTSFTSVSSSQGLPCDSIHTLVEHDGFMWATCAGGIERVALSELRRAMTTDPVPSAGVLYGVAEGMPAQTTSRGFFPAATVNPAGQLLAATPLGLTIIEPPNPRLHRQSEAAVTAVTINGKVLSPSRSELHALGDNMDLTIEFSAPTFRPENRVAFAYKLQGHDENWHLSYGPLRQVSYAGLPPGAYTFVLRTFDGLGQWTAAAATQALCLQRAFYKRLWVQLLAVAVLCTLVAALLVWRSRRLHARYQAIQDERARIARDLHDHLGQAFASLAIHLEVLKGDLKNADKTAAEAMAGFENILQQTRAETRKSIWRLRTQTLEPPRLDEAIKALVRELKTQFGGAAPQVALRITGQPFSLPPHVVDEATQIAREALINCFTHANARHMVIDVDRTANGVRLKVTDDGKGFDRSNDTIVQGHFGLIGMQERAIRAGGTVRVDSSPGLGTEVVLIVPENRPGN